MKIYISDQYTDKVYEKLRITKEFKKEEDDIIKKYDGTFILYSPTMHKIFKEVRKDGTPIFTEKYKYAKSMNLFEAYFYLKYIRKYNVESDRPLLEKILDKPFLLDEPLQESYLKCGLKVCRFNFI